MPISDKYGPTLIEDFDVIIVSPETYNNAVEINDKRIKKGKKPMKIIKIPYALAKDGTIISTSRIIKKEIDKEGNLILKD
jgi:pantetheine-phosphate adenylyltransferase